MRGRAGRATGRHSTADLPPGSCWHHGKGVTQEQQQQRSGAAMGLWGSGPSSPMRDLSEDAPLAARQYTAAAA